MPPKKRNAFYYFMEKRQPEISKREKRCVPMSEMPHFVHHEWKQLPEQEKKIYKKMNEDENSCREKLDCRGVPYSLIKERERDAKKKEQSMQDEIEQTIEILKSNKGLQKKNFFILTTSYYVLTAEGSYTPSEIGIIKFNFNDGLIDQFNHILTADIPTGYRHEAMQQSELLHQLMTAEEKDCRKPTSITSALELFIKEKGPSLPPLYCRDEQREQSEKIINLIMSGSKKDAVKVYSLEYFLKVVYSTLFPENPIPESIAEEWLDSCSFDYIGDLPCKWHRKNAPDAGKHCTLACCKRFLFLMCDHLKIEETFGVKCLAGRHLPLQSEAAEIYDFRNFTTVDDEIVSQISQNEYEPSFNPSLSADYQEEFPSLGSSKRGVAPLKGVGGKELEDSADDQCWLRGVGRGRRMRTDN